MAEPFIGEVRMVGFNFPPKGWAFCNGQLLSIAQNQALFAILGTTFGGNGVNNFGLPNLQGNVPIGVGPNTALGQTGGEVNHTLVSAEMAAHNHTFQGTTTAGADQDPANDVVGTSAIYSPGAVGAQLGPGAMQQTGGGQPHANMQPYQVLNFIVALTGIFPTRS